MGGAPLPDAPGAGFRPGQQLPGRRVVQQGLGPLNAPPPAQQVVELPQVGGELLPGVAGFPATAPPVFYKLPRHQQRAHQGEGQKHHPSEKEGHSRTGQDGEGEGGRPQPARFVVHPLPLWRRGSGDGTLREVAGRAVEETPRPGRRERGAVRPRGDPQTVRSDAQAVRRKRLSVPRRPAPFVHRQKGGSRTPQPYVSL